MVRISTHIIIPNDGLYRFYLNCNDAAFVMVDRKIRAEWAGRHPPGEWQAGSLVYLDAGPHMLEVYGAARGVTRARIALSDSKNENERIPVEKFELVSSATPEALRVEEKAKTLHAGFSYAIGRPYKFRGFSQIFVPVSLRDFSRNDLPWPYSVKWRSSADGALPEGPGDIPRGLTFQTGSQALMGGTATQVFNGLGLHRVSIEVRDKLGFVSVLERKIDTRNLQFREYAVSAAPVNVCPYMFVDDVVDPAIRVVMQGAAELDLLLEWRWTDVHGEEKRGSSQVDASSRARIVTMFSAKAGDIAGVEWELSHCGYRIDGGRMKFNAFPYASFPERVTEDRLYDAKGNQLVYVSSRSATDFKQSGIRGVHLKGGVLCMDDMLSVAKPLTGSGSDFEQVLGRMLSLEADSIRLHRISMRGGHDFLGTAGILLKTAEKSDSLSGVAVLSVGFDHYLAYDRPSDFERMLACMTDMLLSRRTLRTILVTVPPAGSDREAVREYAAAVRRVAAARGVPVADLYSGFMGMGKNIKVFEGDGPELSEEGLRLACQIIARTIVTDYRAE